MRAGRQFSRAARASMAFIVVLAVALFISGGHTWAHKPVTSKYDYNRDVFPLLRDHCGRCHVKGGPGPMSLMTYADAAPWAVSIRDEVSAGRMPPWPVDPTSPPVRGGQPIGSREINTIIEWASGGTPEGNVDQKLPAVAFNLQWKPGPPDLEIPMEVEHTLAKGAIEDTSEFSLAPGVSAVKWVKAADLLPGNASIVRDAVISIENGPLLALWHSGNDTTPAPAGAAFKLTPGSKIHLQIHYKKHFDQEQLAVSDKSTIGLYFTDPPPSGHELQSLVIGAHGGDSAPGALAGRLAGPARIVALRTMLDRGYESVNIDAVTPSGMHVPLLRLRGPRPQWSQRYWLEQPVGLAAASEIRVTATPLSDYSDEPKMAQQQPLQVVLDYVEQ